MNNSELSERFYSYINDQKLFADGNKVLLAVSGGIDSVVMAHLFFEAKIKFGIAHCNFRLRGRESDADKQFVKKIAREFKVKFYSRTFDTKKFAAENKISVQMAARELRYEFFEELRNEYKYDFTSTAHNADDSAETVLLNLVRGTGIAGYHGILPKNKKVIRPLLFASREDILKYAKRKKIKWREDSSNQSEEYMRNKMRLKIIPKLKKINPSILDSFHQHSLQMSEVELLFREYMDRLKKELLSNKGKDIYINIPALQKHNSVSTLLYELLKKYNFNSDTAKEISECLDSQPGKRFFSSTHQVLKDRDHLILSEKTIKNEEEFEISEDDHAFSWNQNKLYIRKITLTSDLKENILTGEIPDKNSAYLDAGDIKFPLFVRKWVKGDYFYPLGMKGKKLLSDYFIDKKIPVTRKENTWLLTSENNIVWVIGEQPDDRYKIKDESKTCLQLIFEK